MPTDNTEDWLDYLDPINEIPEAEQEIVDEARSEFKALEDRIRKLEQALTKLMNEATGVIALAGEDLRASVGNTNLAVLGKRIEEAKDLLK